MTYAPEGEGPGLMNFDTALAYYFCLALPSTFTQPGDRLLAKPCNFTSEPSKSWLKQPCRCAAYIYLLLCQHSKGGGSGCRNAGGGKMVNAQIHIAGASERKRGSSLYKRIRQLRLQNT